MARKKDTDTPKQVDEGLLQSALAASVAAGDIVNFRFLFGSFSPGRTTSPEAFEDAKYAYLQPTEELAEHSDYREALELVRAPGTWAHIKNELSAERPAQLPSELVLPLADNALERGKYTIAAQAYELLRVRRKMQDLLFEEAQAALDTGDTSAAVHGFRVAAALDYDYSAFPEPLPQVADYQKRALILHARHPSKPEDVIGLRPDSEQADLAISFLLNDAEAFHRLDSAPVATRVDFAVKLVHQVDPDWQEFVDRYARACSMTQELADALMRKHDEETSEELAVEIAEQQTTEPQRIMAELLGRKIEPGEWWQYLKDIAYEHPAGVLFLCRQMVGDADVLLPKRREDSELARRLGLLSEVAQPQEVAAADTGPET